MTRPVHRYERDLRQVTDGLVERVYARAERRQHEANRKEGRIRLRDRIGIMKRPPKNFRERCLGVREEPIREPDFIDRLRQRRKEREQRVRHS